MKAIIMVALAILPTLVKAQRDTIVPMPISVARQIAKDLVIGDSCKEVLTVTKQTLRLTEEKVQVQDTMLFRADMKLTNKDAQVKNLEGQVSSYRVMCSDYKQQVDAMTSKYRRAKGSKTAVTIISMFVTGTLSYLLIRK